MKNKPKTFLFILPLVFSSCWWYGTEDDFVEPQSFYEAQFLSRAEFDESIKLVDAKPITNSGKIYVKDNLLFVNEKNEGFHIYDNTDPSNPQKVKFLEAPGATDMAIRNNIAYVNQAVDLVALTIDYENLTVVTSKRIKNTFPLLISPDGFYTIDVPDGSVVYNWILKN